jgi:hypothetical protein
MTEQKSNELKNKSASTVRFDELPGEMQEMFRKLQLKSRIVDSYHKAYFGNSPPIVSVEAFGRRMVASGSKIVHADDPSYDWETPLDFLVSYLKSKLGINWLNQEFQKDPKDQHEVAKWYIKGVPNIEKKDDRRWWKPNGKALALLHLAYDLYVLDNIAKLPIVIVDRLKINDNFNGARYEVFMFATLIRAGFDISYSDERSGLSGRFPECLATHIESQTGLYAEAKTRNVKYIMGSKKGKSNKIRLYDKFKDAIDKNLNGPYIVFLDLNLPEFKAEKGNIKLEKVRAEYRKVELKYKGYLPNLVCITNIPFHYGADDISPSQSTVGLLMPHFPKYPLDSIGKLTESVNSSLKKYDFLPKEFNESDRTFRDQGDNNIQPIEKT